MNNNNNNFLALILIVLVLMLTAWTKSGFFSNEITKYAYSVSCENIEGKKKCTEKNADRQYFVVYPEEQFVVSSFEGGTRLIRYSNCAVIDTKTWKCSPSGYAFGFREGEYFSEYGSLNSTSIVDWWLRDIFGSSLKSIMDLGEVILFLIGMAAIFIIGVAIVDYIDRKAKKKLGIRLGDIGAFVVCTILLIYAAFIVVGWVLGTNNNAHPAVALLLLPLGLYPYYNAYKEYKKPDVTEQ